MEIKILCGCGTKYKFDIEPANGRMPTPVKCPNCGNDGTWEANQQIARTNPQPAYAPPAYAAPVAAAPMAAAPVVLAPRAPTAGGGELRLSRAVNPAPVVPDPAAAGTGYARGGGSGSLLERTTFFIKERPSGFKLTDTYDILDPVTGEHLGLAKEEPPVWAKWLRLAVEKSKMPTVINIYEAEGAPPVLSVRRGITFPVIGAKIHVVSGDGRTLGQFKKKIISLGGGFNVFDHANTQVAEVKGNWKGWDFRFLNTGGREIGTVTKKWAGLARELFTSADNYVIALTDLSSAGPDAAGLLLAAGLAIDIVYKEDE